MRIFRTTIEMRDWSLQTRTNGKKIGFVPTMGFLHEGHLSLVDLAKYHTDQTVVSIFVNPTQFAPGEDFVTYPRDEERDLKLLEERKVDVVFIPNVEEMYPRGYRTYVEVENLGSYLCGSSRPGHFRGVTTIVTKLFHTVLPHLAVFGQKDAQQARIIMQMTDDLQFGIKILLGPIIRDHDGLALSSRNVRLTPEHRKQAPVIFRGLLAAEEIYREGEYRSSDLKNIIRETLSMQAPDGIVDYIEIVDWTTLQPIDLAKRECLLAVAVKFGDVRLIDNVLLER